MKRKLKYFAIFLAIVFGFAGFAGILAKKNSQSTYAVNSTSGNVYGSSDSDGLSLNGTDLVVTFTVTSNLQQTSNLTLHGWFLFLYDADATCPAYDADSHLVTENLTYIRDEAVLGNGGYFSYIGYNGENDFTGTIQKIIDANFAFYHSSNNYAYFDDLLGQNHDWKVYIGAGYGDDHFDNTTFAVDLYVGTIGANGTIVSDTQEEELSITFRPVVVGERVYENTAPSEVVVKYYVTYNDGVNSFVLVPSYDKDVFTLLDSENNPRVAVSSDIASAVTVTGNVKNGNDPEFVKIAFDSSTLYSSAHAYSAESDENVLVLTLTFSVHTVPTEYGHFRGFFGLVLDDAGKTNNTSSVAYQDLNGEELGGQEEILVRLDVDDPNEVAVPENVIDIYKRYTTEFTAPESVTNTYRKEPMTVTKVGTINPEEYGVQYQYNGNGTPVIIWKDSNQNVLESAPQNAGTYTVTISIPATDTYTAVESVTIPVTINKALVTVNITNQSKVYGENAITFAGNFGVKVPSGYYTVSGSVYGNDNITFNLTSGVVRTSNAGSYAISETHVSISDDNNGNNYGVDIIDGTYTVSKYTIKIYYGFGQTTFNGGNKDAYSLSGLTPNIKDNDYFELPEDMATLLGTVTVTPSVNFPETGVVPANDPEDEEGYYKVTPLYAFVKEGSANNFDVITYQSDYRINPAQVTLKAGNKSAEFNGGTKANYAAPTDYYVYAGSTTTPVSEALRTALGTVTLTVNFPEGVVNAGTYTITPSCAYNSNFVVTTSNGTYTINAKDLTDEEKAAIYGAFGIVEVTYDGQGHQMYTFDASGLPLGLTAGDLGTRYSYLAKINDETASDRISAGTYPVTIIFTINDATINQNRNSTYGTQVYQPLSFTFEVKVVVDEVTNKYSSISQKAITITAADKGHVYGNTPQTLTPTTAGINGEIAVTFTVKNGNDTITLAKTTNVGTYTIVPSASNANYNITLVNGTYEITKATPVLEIGAMSTYYNSHLYIYWPTITVGNLVLNVNGYTHDPEENPYGFEYAIEIWKGNQKVLNDAWISENYWLDAGTDYTAKLVLTGNDNYYSASASSNTFEIMKVYVGGPNTITYNGNTVTWSEVTKDVDGKNLHNSTVTYKISGTEYANRSFTATAKGTYCLTITTSNKNYEASDLDFDPVYSVIFREGTHTANPTTPTNMPAVQYVFKDQKATQPATNPSLTGYTFAGWNCGWEFNFDFNAYEINDGMVDENGDCYLTAQWNILYYTVTFKYTEDANVTSGEGQNVFTVQVAYKSLVDYESLDLQPTKSSDNVGIEYQFAKWLSNETEYTDEELDLYVVTENVTFVAQYTTNYISFTITYYVKENGGNYVEQEYKTEVAYNSVIEYRELETDVKWFTAKAWFANEAATEAAPATMPNHNIEVYGAIVFDIGTGDVNGNGQVNADDITLYRQWIVGGYSMTVVEAGTEWATATAEGFNPNGVYFLMKVADNNIDLSRDIRDVSITRMSIVGGYTWAIESGVNVTGQEIMRNERPTTASALAEKLASGKKINLVANINDPTYNLVVATSKDVYLDLRGYTVNVNKFTVVSEGEVTITILNGTIRTSEGITISAPNGDVVLTDLEGYDANGLVNLAAGSNSLHLNGVVEFYSYQEENEVEVVAPAAVHVEKNTHVVVEAAAEVVVAKLVVTENFVPTVAENVTISVNNLSAVATVAVQGNYVNENEIHDLAELKEAALKGGSYVLANDFTATSDVYLRKDFTLDLNNYTITFTGWGFEVTDGAKFTLNGNGGVSAVEAPLYATNGATLVVNGGTYSATDNFVVGTHGSTGRGGNTILINGGTFNGSITSAGYVACGVYVANRDTVTITAGTFTITNGVGLIARCGETTIGENVVFNVTGNGTLGKIGDSSVVLPSGAVLVVDFASNYPGLNDSFVFTNETEYPILTNVASEAQLRAAFEYEGTVVLLADIRLTDQVVSTNNVTLELNGHKLYNTTDIWAGSSWSLVSVQAGKLTINGEGSLLAKANDCYALDIRNGANLVINGGTYVGNIHAVYVHDGALTVNGGHYSVIQKYDATTPDGYVLNCLDANYQNGTATIVVKGGSYEGFNPADCPAESPRGHFVPAEYYVVEAENVYTVLPKTYVSTEAQLRAAFEVGGYVVLTNDISVTGEDRLTITVDTNLDLNGHTLKSADGLEPTGNWATLWVNNGAVANISNGTIGSCYDSDGVTTAPYGIVVGVKDATSGTVNLTNVTVCGGISAVYVIAGEANIYSGNYIVSPWTDPVPAGLEYEYLLNCWDTNYGKDLAHINVYGGTFENFNPADCAAEAAQTNFVSEGHVVTSEEVGEKIIYTVA